MPRDTNDIERDIERARDQLATTVDELSVRANPKRLVESVRSSVATTLEEPKVRAVLVGVGAVVVLLVVRAIR